MYKKILLILISAIILSITTFTIIILIDTDVLSFKKSTASEEQEVIIDVEPPTRDADDDKESDTDDDDNYINLFNQSYKKEEMKDEYFRDYIHKMSHQKVIADEKWGFYKITDERIDWLIESLKVTKENVPSKDMYETILLKWKKGDFSEVDEDHNRVWQLQNGSIGEATGIMSEEAEKEYIENTPETTK